MTQSKIKYTMYEKNNWTIKVGAKSPRITIEALRFISDTVRSDQEKRPYPKDLANHPYFRTDITEYESLQSLLVKASMDFNKYFSKSEEIVFNTEKPEEFDDFYEKVYQKQINTPLRGNSMLEDNISGKSGKPNNTNSHISFKPTSKDNFLRKQYLFLVFGGPKSGKT